MATKFQVTFPEAFVVEARTVAARLRIPLAQFIRESMQLRMNELRNEDEGARPRFFDRFDGVIDTAETDLSTRVDDILYGDEPNE
ncbi:MAG TPA: hypothetical protein VMJ34_00995 [Bryobacteraceae bacterium]|nr:hypothetical protein [Bryobacteraceae bacterium]